MHVLHRVQPFEEERERLGGGGGLRYSPSTILALVLDEQQRSTCGPAYTSDLSLSLPRPLFFSLSLYL